MKRKFTFLTFILCMICLSIVAVPAMASSDAVTNFNNPVIDENIAIRLKFGGNQENFATFGPDRAISLQDNETVSMKFTILSENISNKSVNNVGFMIAPNDLSNLNYYENFSIMGNNVGLTINDKVKTNQITNVNRDDLFKVGNQVEIAYKPYVSADNKGNMTVKYKSLDSSDFVTVVNAELGESAGKNLVPYIVAYDTFDLIVKDYSVITSNGADLVSYAQKTVDGQYTKGIGVGYAQQGASFDYVITSSNANQTLTCNGPDTCYSGAGKPANVNTNEQLVLEFDIVDSNIQGGNFGAYLSWDNEFSANIWGQSSIRGIFFYSNGQSPAVIGNISVFDNISQVVEDIYAKGNSVRISYKPCEGRVKDYSAYFEISIKNANHPEFTKVFYYKFAYTRDQDAEGITSANLDTANQNLYIRLMGINHSNFSLKMNNYHEYVLDGNGNKDMVFDARYGGADFTNSTGASTPTSLTDDYISYDKLDKAESLVTFNNHNGEKLYNVFVKTGENYVLPSKVDGLSGKLIKWQTADNTLFDGGNSVTVNENLIFNPIIADITMTPGASIRTVTPTGLRFQTNLDYVKYNALKKVATSMTLGTLIVPQDMLNGIDFTMAALDEKGIKYINIVNKGWYNRATAQNDGVYSYYGSIVNIKDCNIARKFSSVAYMKFEINGKTYIEYSPVVTRSVNEVAKKFINDKDVTNEQLKTEIKEKYIDTVLEIKDNNIVEFEGYKSPYTINVDAEKITITAESAQKMVLKNVIVDGVTYLVEPQTNQVIITLKKGE